MGGFGRKKLSASRSDTSGIRPEPAPGGTPQPGGSEAAAAAAADDRLGRVREQAFQDLFDTIDASELRAMDTEAARERVAQAVEELLANFEERLAPDERQTLTREITNEVLGFGPLEPLLARDDVTDIMVNGPDKVYVETGGKTQSANVRFRSQQHLMEICRKIAQAVGRRVDESQPICDARLADGSRVNIIAPPLAIDGTALTIRKFSEDKLTLEDLIAFGSITESGADILRIAAQAGCNILVSGGTGSGKTTLLNCLTAFIEDRERIVTCEDAAELQLQQPHVVRLETRPPNMEGKGEITMRDLVRNCLRMRPDRIVVGEVRGPEALDLLTAMNTGHDGSMGTVHANAPRDALSRLETMIAMGGFELPTQTVRQIIRASVDLVVQAARLRDGARRITSISEVVGMEGETISMQEIFRFDYEGEDSNGRVLGRQRPTGITPEFRDQARYVRMAERLDQAVHSDAPAA